RAAPQYQAFCAPALQTSPFAAPLLAPPIFVPHPPPPLRSAGFRPRSLLPSRSGTDQFPLSILREFRRRAPWSTRSAHLALRRSAKRAPCRHIFLRRTG